MAYGTGGRYEFEAPRHVRSVVQAWRVAGIGGHRHQLRLVADPAHYRWQVVHAEPDGTNIDAYDSEAAARNATKRVMVDSGQVWVETSARAQARS